MTISKKHGMIICDAAALRGATEEITEILSSKACISVKQCSDIIVAKSKVVNLVQQHFPGAICSAEILEQVTKTTEHYGLTPENTLFTQSICPDEINHEEGDMPNLFADYFGEAFHMGGLAGIPFTGKTGFGAFSHHVPDNGHAFVLLAPHIGLSESDELGKYTRDGQSHDGAACGAAVGAFAHCCNCKSKADIDNLTMEDDFQMEYIIKEIYKCKDKILKETTENERQACLVQETHRIAKSLLDRIVNLNYGGKESTLVILTGIQINMPRPLEDFFQPLTFQMRTKDGQVIDLLEETFPSVAGVMALAKQVVA